MAEKPLVSVVCPVHNEEQAVPVFYRRVRDALAPVRDRYRFELMFVNNRSEDRTLELLLKLRESDPSVQVLTLSRNFGYQASVSAGLRHAAGAAVAIIDADCEDPPELIPRFLERWEAGCDVVYGLRERRSEFWGLHLLRKAYYRLTRLIADSDLVLDMAEFSLMSARVRDAVLDNANSFPYLRGEIAYAGFRREGLPYRREPRAAGRTHYNFLGILRFAVAGFLSASTFPLRLPLYLLPAAAAVNLAAAAAALRGALPDAWFKALLLADALYLAAFQSMACLYAARTYKNGLRRPLYVVDAALSRLDRPLPGGRA